MLKTIDQTVGLLTDFFKGDKWNLLAIRAGRATYRGIYFLARLSDNNIRLINAKKPPQMMAF